MIPAVHRRNIAAVAGIVLLTAFLAVIAFSPLKDFFASSEQLRDDIREFGFWAPAAIVLIQIIQVVVAPIPGQTVDLANGFLFGWLWGSVLSLVGISIGTVLAIGLAKRFGRPLVEKLITQKGLQNIQPYARRRNQWLFFFLFLLPGTPDDILCFAIGLSSIPFRRAVAIALLGRTPGVVGTVIAGATGRNFNPIQFTAIAIAVSLAMALIVWNTPLGKAMGMPKPKTREK